MVAEIQEHFRSFQIILGKRESLNQAVREKKQHINGIPTTLLVPRNDSIYKQIYIQYQFNNEFNLCLHFSQLFASEVSILNIKITETSKFPLITTLK